MKRLRAAIAGRGFMGRTHLEALRRLGSVDVQIEPDFRRILENPAIDVVHICTPNVLHYEMASAALSAGKHVLCEKPLAISSAEASALVSIAREQKLRHATNHN